MQQQKAADDSPPQVAPKTKKDGAKQRGRVHKWIGRFTDAVIAATRPQQPSSEPTTATSFLQRAAVPRSSPGCDGYVVLNGGLTVGCTPFELREALEKKGVLAPVTASAPLPGSQTQRFFFSSALPFILVRAELLLPKETVLSIDLSSPSQQQQQKKKPTTPTPTPSFSGMVYAVPIASSEWLWKAGSSAPTDESGGFLFILPCAVSVVLDDIGHIFQKPVIGFDDRVLQESVAVHLSSTASVVPSTPTDPPTRNTSSHTAETAAPPVRVLRCTAVKEIPGLFVVPDFLTVDEHDAIWREMQCGSSYTTANNSVIDVNGEAAGVAAMAIDSVGSSLHFERLARRRVAHFNRRFRYGVNEVGPVGDDVNPNPSFFGWMRARLQNADPHAHIDGPYPLSPGSYPCDQLTINYYDCEAKACGIATHVDSHRAFSDAILVVSLGSYTVMEYARWDCPAEVAAPYGVFMTPRSLVIMSGESRYGWTHCIAEKPADSVSEHVPPLRRGDRVSLTWRVARTDVHTKKECPFPSLCDGVG